MEQQGKLVLDLDRDKNISLLSICDPPQITNFQSRLNTEI